MAEAPRISGYRAQSVRVAPAESGGLVLIVKPAKGDEFGIALTDQQVTEIVWLLLRRTYENALPFEPKIMLGRGIVDNVPDPLPMNEIGFQLSHDQSHVSLVLRFGSVLVPLLLDPAILTLVRSGIAEVENALAARPTTKQ